MDRGEEASNEKNVHRGEPEQHSEMRLGLGRQFIEENGEKYRVPYRVVRKITFSGIRKEELGDAEHSARLQYRLMLQDPILKATVNFVNSTITLIYNPANADNMRERTSREEIVQFLAKEGIHTTPDAIEESDYDYYKEFYAHAFNPLAISEHPPYGYTKEEWAMLKPEWERRMARADTGKKEKSRKWQMVYDKRMNGGQKGSPPKKQKREFGLYEV